MIAHSGISIPFGLARQGEIYPMNRLQERNRELESLVEERTEALKAANDALDVQRSHLETEVLQRTAALSIAKEAAEEANRAKSAFLATMSHELRTPMNAIMGMTSIAQKHATDPALIDRLTVIDGASHRLLAIIENILDISRLESERLTLERTDFELDELLKNLGVQLHHKVAEKGLNLEIETAPEIGGLALNGDPLRLAQILLDLADNAVKFTDHGGISLRTHLINQGPTSVRLRFEVQDTGIGIAAKDISRLFSIFEQGDGSAARRYGGSGLGLAISKRLARLMGGDLRVKSELGVGSTFSLSLQMSRAASP